MGLESFIAASPPRIAAPTPSTLISFFIPGFPAAKQWSGNMGLDMHYVIPWPGTAPPAPFPFPYMYSPHIGLGSAPTVLINFVPSSKSGTKGLLFMGGIPHIGFHLIYGPTLVQGCPSHMQEIIIAAMTVLNTGGLQARLLSTSNACNETAPAVSFDLPTATVSPINVAYNVLVGGPDGVDMIGLAFNILGSVVGNALGRLDLPARAASRITSALGQAVVRAVVTGAVNAGAAATMKMANNAVDFYLRPNDGSKSFGSALMDGVATDAAVAFGLGALGSGLGSIPSPGQAGRSGFSLGSSGNAGNLGGSTPSGGGSGGSGRGAGGGSSGVGPGGTGSGGSGGGLGPGGTD